MWGQCLSAMGSIWASSVAISPVDQPTHCNHTCIKKWAEGKQWSAVPEGFLNSGRLNKAFSFLYTEGIQTCVRGKGLCTQYSCPIPKASIYCIPIRYYRPNQFPPNFPLSSVSSYVKKDYEFLSAKTFLFSNILQWSNNNNSGGGGDDTVMRVMGLGCGKAHIPTWFWSMTLAAQAAYRRSNLLSFTLQLFPYQFRLLGCGNLLENFTSPDKSS